MAEIFLGRDQELEGFRLALNGFLSSNTRPERPQVFLISGQGGIGKTTLLRKWLEEGANLAPGQFCHVEVDWQKVRDINFIEFTKPDQIQARALIRALDAACLAVIREHWPQKKNEVQKVLAEIDAAFEKVSLSIAVQRQAQTQLDRNLGDLAIQTLGKLAAVLIEPTGLLEAFTTALIRRGIEVSPELAELILRTLPKSQVDLVVSPGESLARALADNLSATAFHRPLLVSIDTYEIVDELDPLVQLVIKNAGPKVMWLIAGRNDLYDPRNHPRRGWVDGYSTGDGVDHDARRIDLKVLARHQIGVYFKAVAPHRRELDEDELDRIAKATHSIPLAIRLASGIWSDTENVEEIVNAGAARANSIVDDMVARYLRHCAPDPRDSHGLAALAMADGDGKLLAELLLPEVDGDHAQYEMLLTHLRHRYVAVHRDGAQLHEEPKRFINEKYRRKDERQLQWVLIFNERAIAALKKRILVLVEDASSLEELCSEEGYMDDAVTLLDHLFWASKAEAWPWLLNRLVESLAYSTAFRERLIETALAWRSSFTKAQQKRLAILADAETDVWKAEARARRHQLLEERVNVQADPLPSPRFAADRAAILHWDRAESDTSSGNLLASLKTLRVVCRGYRHLAGLLIPATLRLEYAFCLLKDYANAIAAAELAAFLDPQNSKPWRVLGNDYRWLNEYERAIEYHHKALDLNPKDSDAWRDLGTACCILRDYDKAIEYHRQALHLNPQDADAWIGAGYLEMTAGARAAAIKALRKAIELAPKNPNSWTLWALLLYREGALREASIKARRALAIEPARTSTRIVHLGLIRLLKKPTPRSDLEKMWPLIQAERHIRYEAEWLAMSDRSEEALKRLEAAIRSVPDNAVYARFRPAFYDLREDPRFIAMTEEAPRSAWNDYPKVK